MDSSLEDFILKNITNVLAHLQRLKEQGIDLLGILYPKVCQLELAPKELFAILEVFCFLEPGKWEFHHEDEFFVFNDSAVVAFHSNAPVNIQLHHNQVESISSILEILKEPQVWHEAFVVNNYSRPHCIEMLNGMSLEQRERIFIKMQDIEFSLCDFLPFLMLFNQRNAI